MKKYGVSLIFYEVYEIEILRETKFFIYIQTAFGQKKISKKNNSKQTVKYFDKSSDAVNFLKKKLNAEIDELERKLELKKEMLENIRIN